MNIPNSLRLTYKLMGREDAESLFELDQDSEVMRYINGGKKTSRDDLENISIPRMESYTRAQHGWGLWKVSVTRTNEFIGWVLVRPMDYFSDLPQLDNLEIGWRFKQSAWGQGFATEAAKQITLIIAKETKIKYVTAIADKENIGSISVMKKLGLTYQKSGIHKDPLGDTDVVYYRLEVNS